VQKGVEKTLAAQISLHFFPEPPSQHEQGHDEKKGPLEMFGKIGDTPLVDDLFSGFLVHGNLPWLMFLNQEDEPHRLLFAVETGLDLLLPDVPCGEYIPAGEQVEVKRASRRAIPGIP
jgi:hypothetical protein